MVQSQIGGISNKGLCLIRHSKARVRSGCAYSHFSSLMLDTYASASGRLRRGVRASTCSISASIDNRVAPRVLAMAGKATNPKQTERRAARLSVYLIAIRGESQTSMSRWIKTCMLSRWETSTSRIRR